MRTIKVDEYLIVNLYSGKKRWLSQIPNKKSAYDVVIRVKGIVKIPDSVPLIDFGEISIPEIEASAQANMG